MNCELCGEPDAAMDFNCVFPSFDVLVSGTVCWHCFGITGDDITLAVALLKQRAMDRNVKLPTSNEIMLTLCQPQKEEMK